VCVGSASHQLELQVEGYKRTYIRWSRKLKVINGRGFEDIFRCAPQSSVMAMYLGLVIFSYTMDIAVTMRLCNTIIWRCKYTVLCRCML
jgi:hypothetical protein